MDRATPEEGFRSDIQGLRAIAVLSVVLYHANEDLIGGGFVGVDIFFVISGYLITSILARDIQAGRYSIADFYRRRIMRLFPALFLMLAFTLAAGWFILQPADYAELGRTAVSALLFVSNFDFWALTGYFAGDSAMKPLLHTWSLAVEEQFYIVFPILLAAVMRFGRLSAVLLLSGLAAASLAASALLTPVAPSMTFYFTPIRAFELLLGALIALDAAPRVSGSAAEAVAGAGLALIVLSFAVINEDTLFPGVAALAPCLGAGMIIHAGRSGTTRAGRWISNPVFLFFGALSYSLYLWHWPLLVFSRHLAFGEPSAALIAASVAAAVGAAYLSYRFVEQPFLKAKAGQGRVFAAGAGAVLAGVAIAAAVPLASGFPARFPPQARALFGGADDANPRREACHQNDQSIIAYEAACRFGGEAPPSVVVWGDSHGAELVVAIGERLAERGGSVRQLTATVCPPSPGYDPSDRPLCAERNRRMLASISTDPSITRVVLALNFSGYREERRDAVVGGLHEAVARLVASGKNVILVAPIPIMPNDPPSALGMMVAYGHDPARYGTPRSEHEQRNAWVRPVLAELRAAGAIIVEPELALCDELRCGAFDPRTGRSLYFNRTHLSLAGARLIASHIPLDLPQPESPGR